MLDQVAGVGGGLDLREGWEVGFVCEGDGDGGGHFGGEFMSAYLPYHALIGKSR